MSHIAAALAKSKGKDVPAVTEDIPTSSPLAGVSRPPISMPAMTGATDGAAAKRKLIGGAVLAAVVLGGGAWFLFSRRAPEATAPTVAPAVAKSPQPANVVDFSKESAATTRAPGPANPSAVPAGTPAIESEAPPLSEEIFAAVKNFSVSAVITGANPRVLIGGKTYHVGDQVAPGITLHEIRDGLLIFVDEAGGVYQRRF